jgi:phage terminase large subunit-like protein
MSTAAVAERWAEYADGTRGEHFAWWCEEFCRQSIGQFAGLPLLLEPWQVEFFSEALAVDGDGLPFWTSIVQVVPRKNGKTTGLSAFATYHATEDDGQPEVLLAASSDKQADRLFEAAVRFVRRSEYLASVLHVRDYVGEMVRVDGDASILRMSSKAESLHGYNPSLVVADELAQWGTPSLRKAFAALTTAGGARDAAQLFSITVEAAAEDREDSILGRIVDANEENGHVERPHDALTISRNFDSRVLVYRYHAPAKVRQDPVELFKRANPATWITEEYLRKQQVNPELEDADFLQLHGCVSASSREAFLTREEWEACAAPERFVLERRAGFRIAGDRRRGCLGWDGSHTYDTTVLAVASTAADGLIDVDCRIYSVRRDAPHHVFHEGGKVLMPEVEDDVVDLFSAHRLRRAGFDPRFLSRSAELLEVRLPEDALVIVEPTSKAMRDALAAFHRAVKDGRLRHTGDRAIAAHLAATKAQRDDRGWIVRKRRHSKPIDAVPAMAVAVYLEQLRAKVSVYNRRGLTVIGGDG